MWVPGRFSLTINHPGLPANHLQSVSSVQYQIAMAAFHPQSLTDLKREQLIGGRRVKALMEKIQVRASRELERYYPSVWPARVEVTIDNKGVAPIYRNYRLALRFTQGRAHRIVRLKQDVRRWMPDLTYFSEAFTFPRGLKRGAAAVSCAIVDNANRPAVKLAVKPIGADGWHPLTHVDVV